MTTFADAARLVARDRKKTWGHDRSKTVGASEVGKCIRRTVYGKLGLAPDDGHVDSNGFAERGNTMEDNWSSPVAAKWAEAHGGELRWHGQSNQITLIGKGVPLSATPDGLGTALSRKALEAHGVPDIGKSKSVVVEIKSIDPRYAKHKLPKVEHVPQTMVQLGLIRKATEFKPDFGVVMYVDASNYFDVLAFPVKYDDAAFKSLVKRADWIMKCDDPNKALPEGKLKGGSECSECPFAKQCLGFRPFVADDDPRAPTKATIAKIDAVARKVHEAEVAADSAKKQVLEAEADLYLALAETKRNFVKGKFVVHAKKTSPQQRLNQGLLKSNLEAAGLTAEQVTLLFDASKQETKGGTSLSVEVA